MSLRRRLQAYLAILHLALLGTAAWHYETLQLWFFALEALILLSWFLGARLVAQALRPVRFVSAFSDLLHEHEFSARFSTVGEPDMDRLIAMYNRMLDGLYQERLRLGEQRGFLERFMAASPLGVIISDFDDRVTLANPAALAFLEAPEDRVNGRRLDQLTGELAEALAGLAPGEERLITWHGFRRLRIEKQDFIDRGFKRRFALIEELTQLLNESERAAYEKLIRMMSHEVNNTVASTNSLLESCRTYAPQLDDADRGDYANALSVVIARNESLNHFMREFAQLVRMPSPEKKRVELGSLLESLEVMFRPQCRDRGIEWKRNVPADLPPVAVDREQMEQALINVIKNAMEAVERDGQVELAAEPVARGVLLSIYDTGPGLDASSRGELFTPFYTSKSGGQGLGLTLVKEVLLQHGFDFSLETAADGRTRFWMLLESAGPGPHRPPARQ